MKYSITTLAVGRFYIPLLLSILIPSINSSCKKNSSDLLEGNQDIGNQSSFFPCTSESSPAQQYVSGLLKTLANANPETFSGDFSVDKFCVTIAKRKRSANAKTESRTINFGEGALAAARDDADAAGLLAHEVSHIIKRHGFGGVHQKMQGTPEAKLSADAQIEARLMGMKSDALSKETLPIQKQMLTAREALLKTIDTKDYSNPAFQEWKSFSQKTSFLRENGSQSVTDLMLEYGVNTYSQLLTITKDLPQYKGDVETLTRQVKELSMQFFEFEKKIYALAKDQSLKNEVESLELKYIDRSAELFTSTVKDYQASARVFEVESKVLGDVEAKQWKEVEADEFGLQLYLKAGYPRGSMLYFLEKSEASPIANLSECLKPAAPPRGDGWQYPEACWRIWNVRIGQTVPSNTQQRPQELSNPSLNEIKSSSVTTTTRSTLE